MRIILTVDKGVNVEVQPKEDQPVSITDIIATLEFAKTLAISTWHDALLKSADEVENAEVPTNEG